ANDLRHASFLLADELRQSSDDLTRMARTYVVNGDPRYKKYYQDILDIRDGRKPRPKAYQLAYWDLVLANALPPPSDGGQAVPLLELMRQSGFSDKELGKLAEAKVNSDWLVVLEREAMKLAESVGANAEANHARARRMLYDEHYYQAKLAIMSPINEFFVLMDQRTRDTVRKAKTLALLLRLLFIAAALVSILVLLRTFAILRSTLGGTAEEVHAQIVRIGQGDFSTAIDVASGKENSVLAGLREMQNKLQTYETERKESEAFKQAILNSIGAEICVLDRNGVILAVNEPWRRFAQENGVEPGKPAPGTGVGANYLAACAAETGLDAIATDARNGIQAVLDGRLPSFSLEYPCDSLQQQYWFSMMVTPMGKGAHGGAVVTHMDITGRKKSEQALAESENRFSLFMDTLPAAAFIKDENGMVLYVNRYMEDILGVKNWHGKSTRDLFPPELAEKMIADDQLSLAAGHMVTEERVPGVDGQLRIYQTHKVRIPRQGRPPLLGGIALDITERKQMEEQIRSLAYFDSLTGLPNRRLLLDRLDHALFQAKRHQRSMAIMFLDLDNFKKINDTYGHDAGDELLREVSARLHTCVRHGDTVSRQGGDEFIIVLAEITHSADAAQVADKIIKAINLPVQIAGNTLNVTTSIGIAVYPINGNEDALELVKKADKAMYAAKAAGRNGYKFFAE
ncbi:MAG: diguanylate cyclase domain-containing protein, partial [Betaproteobacteria bacterium]